MSVCAGKWMAECLRCGCIRMKKEMRPLFTARRSSAAHRIMGYMCTDCWVCFLDTNELPDPC